MTNDPNRARVLLALAERACAEEPSRELDADIWDALGLTEAEEEHARSWCRQNGRTDLTRRQFLRAWCPEYTTSLDAAAGAMPAGWTVRLFQAPGGDWHVRLFDPSCMMRWATMDPITEPRARTAAALRAMAAEVGE